MRGGGIASAHTEPGTRGRWVVITTLRPLYLWEGPGTHSTEGWVILGVGLDGSGYLVPTGIRWPDLSAHSESLTDYAIPPAPVNMYMHLFYEASTFRIISTTSALCSWQLADTEIRCRMHGTVTNLQRLSSVWKRRHNVGFV